MNIKGKTFLVTGGAGFIGSHTVDALIENGGKVVVVDNLSSGKINNLNPKAKFYKLDISNPQISKIFQKHLPNAVYHFAFNTSVPKSVQHPKNELKSIKGSVNILQNSADFGVEKIVFASSGFIYGNKNITPTSETGVFDPLTPYAIAKVCIENFIFFFNKVKNLNYIIFRYGTVYGPRQVGGAMTDYISKIDSGKQAKIWGVGSKSRDYIYISDVVKANLLALKIPNNFRNPVFNIGTNKKTSLLELYNLIATRLDRKAKPIFLPDRPGELQHNQLDFTKFSKATGWKPLISLDTGLQYRIADYLKNKFK